jgi:tetratricopeptide (TPR) repeat protein
MSAYKRVEWGIAIGAVMVLAGGVTGCASGLHTAEQKKAQKWVERGLASHDKGEYHQAITYYTQAIELNPQDSVAYCHRCNSHYARGSHQRGEYYDLAIADYNEAIRLNPQYVNAYWNRGRAYAGKNHADEYRNQVMQIDPQYDVRRNFL